MTKEEILHLGRLSRIALSETEVATFATSIDSILEYVSVVRTITDGGDHEPKVGARFNVLRPDEVTNVPGAGSEVLMTAFPKREGQFMSVKKILNQPE